MQLVDARRRALLRSLFLGLGAAALPMSFARRVLAAAGGPELDLPLGPLANIGPVERKTPVSGGIAGIDEEVWAPAGFDVRVVARAGVVPPGTSSNYAWHVSPDGGAVFPSTADGGWVYVSNSETTPGGAGALRFDAAGNLVDAYRILDGTRNNCAGGATPWGTWLSCEETAGGLVYECNPFGPASAAVQKPALGALNHEACAIDPIHHVCYETEDGGDQRFYRFVSDPADLTTLPDGTVRMGLATGTLQVLKLDDFAHNVDPTDAELRQARKVSWVARSDVPTNPPLPVPTVKAGTRFNGGEGIWYYEVPEALRTIPALGTVPTRGVMFFATKGTNRVYAYDIENELLETIFDNTNMQIATGFNDVDNVTVSPAGDVLVAEDGELMRICVVVPNAPAKLLMQITRGGSEICGPAFTPDGSRLYFSSQRGPSGPGGLSASGVTFELTIPPQFRGGSVTASPGAFTFAERTGVATGAWVTSEAVMLAGFGGTLPIAIVGGQYSVNGGSYTTAAGEVAAGDRLRVRHLSSREAAAATTTTVTVGGYATTLRSVTSGADRTPEPFTFGTVTGVAAGSEVVSNSVTPAGFNAAIALQPGPGLAYRIDGGAWTTASGTLQPGQAVQVKHVAAAGPMEYRKTYLKAGGVVGYFTTRTA